MQIVRNAHAAVTDCIPAPVKIGVIITASTTTQVALILLAAQTFPVLGLAATLKTAIGIVVTHNITQMCMEKLVKLPTCSLLLSSLLMREAVKVTKVCSAPLIAPVLFASCLGANVSGVVLSELLNPRLYYRMPSPKQG